ncbi:MAG TPA: hypothetical protein VM597_30490 [Gemmataceae bacterium]|jgi:hypothetical protein|nr:hypothetical protein [Gemmataceae bacterium]
MRLVLTAACALFAGVASAADPVELAGMKSAPPADWKEEAPSSTMRKAQFKLPKAEGAKEDAELAIFVFPGGSGTVKQNLDRQLAKFVAEGRKDKTDKVMVGPIEATYQDVTGTYIKKPFPMAEKGTPQEDYRQLYVVFEAKDGRQYYMTLLGPAKTVEKHKKGFEDWLKNFK